MKSILMFLAIVMTGILCFSQNSSESSKFEIGLGIPCFSCTFSNRIQAPLISLKAINGKNAIRSGLFYDLTVPLPLNDFSYIIFNAGYERRFFSSKSKLFSGVDFCYLHKYYREEKNPAKETIFFHVGLGPVIGYSFRFSTRLSLQTEIGLYYGYGENKYYDNGNLVFNSKGGFYTWHRGVSLSLCYYFK